MNAAARLLLRQVMTIRKLKGASDMGDLDVYLRFVDTDQFDIFTKHLLTVSQLGNVPATIIAADGEENSVAINANMVKIDNAEYSVVYISETAQGCIQQSSADGLTEALLTRILHEAYHQRNIDTSIQTILSLAGRYSQVSRVYIFEDIDAETTRNTYEWCAPGVEPAMAMLQNLRKEDYNYDAIMRSSLFIFDDTRTLPEQDRKILYDMQGIKSIAILALYQQDQPLGYIGFDDTVNFRNWTRRDIDILEGIASVVSSLIGRRNHEKELRDSQEVMQTITDNLEDLIFVSDLETYELKFVSKSLAETQGKEPRELLGKRCWEVLHLGQNGPCRFCPISDLLDKDGKPTPKNRVWEFQNDITGKWYLVKNNIIKWIDGKPAHLETAVDITYQKQYTEQLKYSASTDAMTDVYNREWGYAKIKEIVAGASDLPSGPKTLCFIDIDGLKSVNDTLGHAAGDEMIINTIQTIHACIRKEDFICRWGGDEFLLVLSCDLATAKKVVNKILFAVDHFNKTANAKYRLSFSHGEVEIPEDGTTDVDRIINQADALMYKNKTSKTTPMGPYYKPPGNTEANPFYKLFKLTFGQQQDDA